MSMFLRTIIALAIVSSLSLPVPLLAQTSEQGDRGEDGPEAPEGGEEGPGQPGNPARELGSNDSVVASIEATRNYCAQIADAYTIDCLSERLGKLARELEGQKEFSEVQAVLESTSRKLNDIARQNRSTTLAPARFSTQERNPVATTRRLIPVDDANLNLASSQALAVIVEAETLLLRSAEESGGRAIQYQRIADAVGSNKVLLRSG